MSFLRELPEDIGSSISDFSYLDWSRQPWPNPPKLIGHTHDHLSSKGVANQDFWEELEMPQQIKHVSCSTLHPIVWPM